MRYQRDDVLKRDGHRCRFRFRGCLHRANRTTLAIPDFLGGPDTELNARAICRHCMDLLQPQRDRAAELLGHQRHIAI